MVVRSLLTILLILQLSSATSAAPSEMVDSPSNNNVESPPPDVLWSHFQLTRLEAKMILSNDNNQTADRLPLIRVDPERLLNESEAECEKGVCPCSNPNDHECHPDAICLNDRSSSTGYRCQCKTGFVDVFFSEPPQTGKLCVKTMTAVVTQPQPSHDEQKKTAENDRTSDVASSRFLNFNAVFENDKITPNNVDSLVVFPPPPAFPSDKEIGRQLSQAQLRDVFDDLDQDRNETISRDELKNFINGLGDEGLFARLRDADLSRMIELADRNQDGQVEWTEFIRLFLQQKFLRLWAKRRVFVNRAL